MDLHKDLVSTSPYSNTESMHTARRYLAREIYHSCAIVLIALLGLFTFFSLIDELDNLGKISLSSLLYLEALTLPTRLYDLLPVGLLIGAILALAGLAQRNELVILRVSGVSGAKLVVMLWVITVPLIGVALLLSEYITPMAEIRSSEANLMLHGKAGGGRLASGYWFKEPVGGGGTRTINVNALLANGNVATVTLYEFKHDRQLAAISHAQAGRFVDGKLILENLTEIRIDDAAIQALADTRRPGAPITTLHTLTERSLDTTLTPARLLARVLTPERMTLVTLFDYIDYLHSNHLQADRQIVAIWRKIAYPFTLLVMITIAAPIGFMQTRRAGVGAKVFIGILLGVGFFMLNQLALNVGMLSRWPPWLTALGPNFLASLAAIGALTTMESRHRTGRLARLAQRFPLLQFR